MTMMLQFVPAFSSAKISRPDLKGGRGDTPSEVRLGLLGLPLSSPTTPVRQEATGDAPAGKPRRRSRSSKTQAQPSQVPVAEAVAKPSTSTRITAMLGRNEAAAAKMQPVVRPSFPPVARAKASEPPVGEATAS